MQSSHRPSRAELIAAAGKTVADIITEDLHILFCGINPGLYTAAIGHHFGRPGNRFWPTLFAAGMTPRLLDPSEERELLSYGCGITNLVARATATAAELSSSELDEGGRILIEKINRYSPDILAILGVTAYRTAFHQPKAQIGLQSDTIGKTKVWVLPNPSGLNAHYQLNELAIIFRQLMESHSAPPPEK